MSEWRNGKLGELATGIRGVSYTPEQLKEFKNSDTITLLRSNNIQSGWLQFKNIQIVPKSVVSEAQILRFGDIAVCMSNGSKTLVGKAGPFVNLTNEQFTVGAFCSIFRPACGVDCQFTKYIFQSSAYRAQLDISLAGSAINNLRNSEIELFSIKIPPPEHQKKIAKVLDVLDVTIRQTEAIIEKLKLVKQGLLHDLLTRGIDDNGELRPPQSQAPHLYKDSPLGWIPNDWDAFQFSELAEYTNGNTFDAGHWSRHGLPIIRIQNLNGSNSFNYYEGPINSRWHVRPGDLLFAWSGQRGVSFGPRLWSGPEGVLNQHIFKVMAKNDVISKDFLFEILRFRQSVIEDAAHGFKDSFLHVTRGELGAVFAGVPPADEQFMINIRIAAFEAKLMAERATLAKDMALKSALMDDLLTGRVRVTPLLNSPGV